MHAPYLASAVVSQWNALAVSARDAAFSAAVVPAANHKVDAAPAQQHVVHAVCNLVRRVLAQPELPALESLTLSDAQREEHKGEHPQSFDAIVELITTGRADAIPGIRQIPSKVSESSDGPEIFRSSCSHGRTAQRRTAVGGSARTTAEAMGASSGRQCVRTVMRISVTISSTRRDHLLPTCVPFRRGLVACPAGRRVSSSWTAHRQQLGSRWRRHRPARKCGHVPARTPPRAGRATWRARLVPARCRPCHAADVRGCAAAAPSPTAKVRPAGAGRA